MALHIIAAGPADVVDLDLGLDSLYRDGDFKSTGHRDYCLEDRLAVAGAPPHRPGCGRRNGRPTGDERKRGRLDGQGCS